MAGWRDGEVIVEAVNQNRAEWLAGERVPEADRGIAGNVVNEKIAVAGIVMTPRHQLPTVVRPEQAPYASTA